MIDAGTVAEADELDGTELTNAAVVDWAKGEIALDDAAVTEGGIIAVDTPVEDPGLEIKVEGVDFRFDAGGIKMGVDVGVSDEAVVGGGTGVNTVDVERTATGGVLGSVADFTTGGVLEMIALGDVVGTTGFSSGRALEIALLYSGAGATPYTGAFSSHGNVGHTAVTRAQWMKRRLKMPNGNWVSRCIPSVGFQFYKLVVQWTIEWP